MLGRAVPRQLSSGMGKNIKEQIWKKENCLMAKGDRAGQVPLMF